MSGSIFTAHDPQHHDLQIVTFLALHLHERDAAEDTIQFASTQPEVEGVWKINKFCGWFNLTPEELDILRFRDLRQEYATIVYDLRKQKYNMVPRPLTTRKGEKWLSGRSEDFLAAKNLWNISRSKRD